MEYGTTDIRKRLERAEKAIRQANRQDQQANLMVPPAPRSRISQVFDAIEDHLKGREPVASHGRSLSWPQS